MRNFINFIEEIQFIGEDDSSSFDPVTLFANGEPGAIIDFTDLLKMFTISDGSTPVANILDPIGRVEDPSPNAKHIVQATVGRRPIYAGHPLTYDDDIVINGRMSADNDWIKGTGWTIASGIASKSAGVQSSLSEPIILEAGAVYVMTFSMKRTAGTITARLVGGNTVAGIARSLSGSWREIFWGAPTGPVSIDFLADAAFAGSIDNIVLRKVLTFGTMGARFDGVDDRMAVPINMSGSDKATLIIAASYAEIAGTRVVADIGSFFASLAGSFAIQFSSILRVRLFGSVGTSSVELTPALEAPPSNVSRSWLIAIDIDLSQAAQLDEVGIRTRGVEGGKLAQAGAAAGGGNLANSIFTIGASTTGAFFWNSFVRRAILIGRLLTNVEVVNAEKWVRSGTCYCAVIGDSTVARNAINEGIINNYSVSSLTPGMVCGAADIAQTGDDISEQLADWAALVDKSALEAVIIQIGLNDCVRLGATASQIISDYQNLVDTVRSDIPPDCKILISQMIPAGVWLDAGANVNGRACHAALNEAIAGNGATPITGVDRRITAHYSQLDDGSGNLKEIYDSNPDGVHENTEARLFIIAPAWREALVDLELIT